MTGQSTLPFDAAPRATVAPVSHGAPEPRVWRDNLPVTVREVENKARTWCHQCSQPKAMLLRIEGGAGVQYLCHACAQEAGLRRAGSPKGE